MSDPLQDAWDFLAFRDQELPEYPQVGERVAGYELLAELGRGAGGVVFRARRPAEEKDVALKLVALGVGEMSDRALARIEDEARLLAQLHHPNIVRVHQFGAIPAFRWMAMEWIDGWSLRRLAMGEAEPLPKPTANGWLPFALQVLVQVASALEAAHEKGVVHRDVKPSNVLVDRQGQAYLVDFGLAQPSVATGRDFDRGFVGTPRYASPEQVRGEPLSSASDVFSLGVVAFELLAGVPAFDGGSTREVLEAVQFRDPVWPADRPIPDPVRAVVQRCMEKKITDAYQTAREARLAIEGLQRSLEAG